MQCIKQGFIHHASLAFFARAWADQCEESDAEDILSGQEIMDVMPSDTDKSAIRAAERLLTDVERLNQCAISELMTLIEEIGDGDMENTLENFAHYCAMQAMGCGVGLEDAFGDDVYDRIKVPYVEFGGHSLSVDYFKSGT